MVINHLLSGMILQVVKPYSNHCVYAWKIQTNSRLRLPGLQLLFCPEISHAETLGENVYNETIHRTFLQLFVSQERIEIALNRGHEIWHRPNQCTLVRDVSQNYHTFARFDPSKMGNSLVELLLMEEILHQMTGRFSMFFPMFTRLYNNTSRVVQDFFHQQYKWISFWPSSVWISDHSCMVWTCGQNVPAYDERHWGRDPMEPQKKTGCNGGWKQEIRNTPLKMKILNLNQLNPSTCMTVGSMLIV